MNPSCPKCLDSFDVEVTQPIEEDVGIMSSTYGCKKCKIEFWIDESGHKHTVTE